VINSGRILFARRIAVDEISKEMMLEMTDNLGALTDDDEWELVDAPHEETTHVDNPRYTSPVSDVKETEKPALTTDALDNLAPAAAELDCRSHLRAPVHTYGSMRWFGVLVLMAILRLSGAPKQPTACNLPTAPVSGTTMRTTLEWGERAARPSWRGLGVGSL